MSSVILKARWVTSDLTSHLCCWAQGFLQLPALLLLIQASLVVIVGDVSQDHGLLGNGQDAALHRRDLKKMASMASIPHDPSGFLRCSTRSQEEI